MDIVIGSWEKTQHKRNRSGGSNTIPLSRLEGAYEVPPEEATDLSLMSRDRFIPAGLGPSDESEASANEAEPILSQMGSIIIIILTQEKSNSDPRRCVSAETSG